MGIRSRRSFGFAWVGFALLLAIHVLDEAVNNFLSVFNANAQAIRARVPFLKIPTLTPEEFLTGLFAAIVLLLCLSPFAFRGVRWLRIVAVPIAIVAGILNASMHMLSSIYYLRWMPGVYSSPLLLAAAIFLLVNSRKSPDDQTI